MAGYGYTGGPRRKTHMGDRPKMLMPHNADPFQYTKRSTSIQRGLQGAPRAKPSGGFIGALVHMLGGMHIGENEHFYNQKGLAEGHRHYDTKGLTPQQIHLLAQIFASHSQRTSY